TGESTPTVTGFFEVTVDGKLVHSKKNGDEFPDTKDKMDKIMSNLGTEDKTKSIHETARCFGYGASLQCFIPVEIYKHYLSTNLQKRTSQCQRCSLFSYTNPISHCQVNEHIYRDILTEIKRKRALIILIVDLLDITNSISRSWTHLVDQTTDYHNTSPNIIFVLGNKVDLLPKCRFVCNYK
ncbi:unnamed protein product, partial [Rotaria sp. Silwood1]